VSWLGWLLLAVLLLVGGIIYLAWYMAWEARHTQGMAYYGLPVAERRRLKRRMRLYSLPAKPMAWLLAPLARRQPTLPAFEYEGVYGPPRVSSPEVFERARRYQPQPEDVFVATQMRSGTTWMQQIVYEVVSRGRGDLSDEGHGHLYAMSPWIDAVNSVSMDDAPLVGERPSRIIKTHLPASLCPFGDAAKYIYVTRHPVSCFASIVDYNRSLLGPLMPPIRTYANWFCSDRMYWGPWPEHVAGWWDLAERHGNVLFVHFEEMKTDLPAVVDRVASLLGCPLSADERQHVVDRCSFGYMRDREDWFEMSPPTMFSVTGGRFMASGKAARHDDVGPEVRERIVAWCREALRGREYPAARYYPDLAAPPDR